MYGQKRYQVYPFKYLEYTQYILEWSQWKLQLKPTR
jgi:hypothetical protein